MHCVHADGDDHHTGHGGRDNAQKCRGSGSEEGVTVEGKIQDRLRGHLEHPPFVGLDVLGDALAILGATEVSANATSQGAIEAVRLEGVCRLRSSPRVSASLGM